MTNDFERYRDELLRHIPELGRAAVSEGWLLGYLPVDPATQTAAGVEVEDPERGPVPATWTPGRQPSRWSVNEARPPDPDTDFPSR